jgi:hypothetical protein
VAGVALLKAIDDPESVQVVVEAQTVALHAAIERTFAGVTERWMTDIMHQGQRLGQIDVETESLGDVARYLRDLHRMGQPAAEVVGGAAGEDLCLACKPPKGS